jgi:RHS repeat-associated protein
VTDYSPFGVTLDGRTMQNDFYRQGFNGMEKDDEVKGEGNSYDFGARMYDARSGRWLTIDALAAKYPSLSPYNFVANSPLIYVDFDGRDIIYVGTPKQVQAAKDLVANVRKDPKMAKVIDKLEASDVKFFILVASTNAAGKHTNQKLENGQASASYRLKGGDEGVTIGVSTTRSTPANILGAISDELKTGEQYLDGKLGFEAFNGVTSVIGYDPIDELETKIAAADVLKINGFSSNDLIPEKASTRIIAAYEKMPKDAQGELSEEDKSNLLNVLWDTAYNPYFVEELKVTDKSSNVNAKDAGVKVDSRIQVIRREGNTTVKEKGGTKIK